MWLSGDKLDQEWMIIEAEGQSRGDSLNDSPLLCMFEIFHDKRFKIFISVLQFLPGVLGRVENVERAGDNKDTF